MKLIIRLFGLLFLLVSVSGCLSLSKDYEKHADAFARHSEAESARVQSQASEIRGLATETPVETKNEALLLSVIAMLQVERLKPVPFALERPTTGYDVLGKAVDHIPFVATVGGMWQLGEAGINAAGNVMIGENANITNSLNTPEVHATGEGNTITYSGTAPRQVVTPVVIGGE